MVVLVFCNSFDINTYVAFGPKRFNLKVMISSARMDLRDFERITFEDDKARKFDHDYKVVIVAPG